MQRLVMSMMSKGRVKAGFISFWWWGVYHILGEYFTYRNDKKKNYKNHLNLLYILEFDMK